SCGATNPSIAATDIRMLAASAASERFVIPHSNYFGELNTSVRDGFPRPGSRRAAHCINSD
ncbi:MULTISPECIES: hypothetical protein, partial [unclassified Burkholderia]|uniref:hypothetical protein n=1 Tax=Burkholderia sp. LMG 13014 TaxID=2709306 RepID=UPI00196482AB